MSSDFEKVVTMVVARGRTVIVEGVARGEGDEISLPREEAEHLHSRGFLLRDGEANTRPPLNEFISKAPDPQNPAVIIAKPT